MEALRNIMPTAASRLPVSVQVIGATVLFSFIYYFFSTRHRPWPQYPVISVGGLSPNKSWQLHCRQVMEEGAKQTNGVYQVMTGTGPKIVLPNRYADEIRNLPELNFPKAFVHDFFINYPGFEPHRQGLNQDFLLKDTIRTRLTQSLGLVTGDIVDETVASLETVLPLADDKAEEKGEEESEDKWSTRTIREDMLEVVARVSSRVFLGAELCRNRRWLDIAKTFTVDTFALSMAMRAVPTFFRPLAYLRQPQSRRLRRSVRDARSLIMPEVERRKRAVDAARAAGEKPPKTADAIGWMYEIGGGGGSREGENKNLDLVAGQLSLSMAAIHTTTENLARALIDLCKYPDVMALLRDEIIEVVGKGGWAKTTLYKLRLMDSFLKESQRLTPMGIMSMNRYVEKKVTLSDGIVLPKGARICVAADFGNAQQFPDPTRFDAARFIKKRQEPGQENGWQFVSTSAAHLSFGHGEHACPGRFFASNEIKIILCHLLLKYDWRFVPDVPEPVPHVFEASMLVRPDTQIQARRRTPEIDLDTL